MRNKRVRVRRGATTYNLDSDMEFEVMEEIEERVIAETADWYTIESETGWRQRVRRADCEDASQAAGAAPRPLGEGAD